MITLERYYENDEMKTMIFSGNKPVLSVTDAYFNKETNLYEVTDKISINGTDINIYFSFDEELKPVGIIYNDYLDSFTLLNDINEYKIYKNFVENYIKEDKENRVKRHMETQEKFIKVRKKVPNDKK